MQPGDYKPISVVMATYNGGLFLEEQLESILAQSLKSHEIIVCDDQSSDDTIAILENYQRRGLLKYYINDERLGVIGNFKKAVSLASRVNYVALADQDDIWMPEKLERSVERLALIEEDNKPSMIYSDLLVVDRNLNILNRSFWNELGQDNYNHTLKTLLFGNFITGCTILMNSKMRDLFPTIPENVSMHDAWLALIAYTFGAVDSIPDPLVKYRKHENNEAHSTHFRKKNRLRRLRDYLRYIWLHNDYLDKEFNLVQKFYDRFRDDISHEQTELLLSFLQLRNKSFIGKKLAFERSFKGQWKKSRFFRY